MPWIKQPWTCGPRAAIWEKLIDHWAQALDRYEDVGTLKSGKREVGYWNTERSNVGFLVAAAFLAAGVATTEFEQKSKHRGHGYVDLWFRLEKGGPSFVCEAKTLFSDDPDELHVDADGLLAAARRDVAALKDDGSFDHRAAIAFVAPFGQTPIGDWDAQRQAFSSRALVASGTYRATGPAPVPAGYKHHHPGIMILVEEVS